MQVYLMLVHRSGLILPVSFREWHRRSRELKLPDLQALYAHCHDDLLVQLMFSLKAQRSLMVKEIQKRMNNKPAGMAIFMGRWNEIERLWIQKRRLKVDPSEVKQDGMHKGLELVNRARKKSLEEEDYRSFLNLPPPILPVEMDEFETSAWRALIQDAWAPSLQAVFENLVPLVRGDVETIGCAVDNFLREERRKDRRRKLILKGKDKFPTRGPESWRAEWDFSEPAAKSRQGEIYSEKGSIGDRISNPEEILTEDETRRENLKETLISTTRAYEIAAERSGEKGIAFIDGLKAGKTEALAACQAGMSDKTGRRILKLIRETYLEKPHKKTGR